MKKHIRFIALLLVLVTILGTVPSAVSAAEPVIDENSGWYWPTVYTKITSAFGKLRSDGKYHQGIDIKAPLKTEVYATRNGEVYQAGWNSSMGNYICIRHGKNADGKYIFSTYMHLNEVKVKKGDTVSTGDVIGLSGNTGASTGPHLHFHVFRATTAKPSSVSPGRSTKAALNKNYVDVGKITYNGTSGNQSAASTLAISVTSAPKDIKLGSGFGMRGSVTSNYTITRVDGSVCKYDNNGKLGAPVMSSVDFPNAATMDIRYSQVNNALIFNNLSVGKYRLLISATDSSGKTEHWGEDFTVYGDPSTLKINWTRYPESLKKGKCFGLRGTITSNYTITEVRGFIIGSSGVVDQTVDYPNSCYFDIRYGNINNYLEFNKLARGTYTLQIEARDTSGRIVAIARQFTIK